MRQYIGARYVPKFADPILHDPTRSYEAFEIVQNAVGDSFTSKKPVPVGVALTDTTFWVPSGNFNSQLAEVAGDLAALTDVVDKIPTKRNIILIGDSYVQGVGGDGNYLDIERNLKSLTGWDVTSFYAGGCGYLRPNTDNKTMLSCVQDAVASTTDKDLVTDVVLMASAYNDIGMVRDPSFNENGFYNAIKSCSDLIAANFSNANITLIPALWINVTFNIDFSNVATWEENSAIKLGLKFAHNAINWLQVYDSSVNSGDNVHPSALGYKYIADHVSCILRGKDPGVANFSETVTTATNDALTVTVTDHKIVISGQVTRNAGEGPFTSLCTLPISCDHLVNIPIRLQKYGSISGADSISTLITAGRSIYVGSDALSEGVLYIIYEEYPINPSKP